MQTNIQSNAPPSDTESQAASAVPGTSVARSARSLPWERIVADVHATRDGPTLICLGGIHGNEPAGLIAARQVTEKLACIAAKDNANFRGRVVVIAGHRRALNAEDTSLRYFEHDLNRMFLSSIINTARATPLAARSAEERELVELLETFEPIIAGAASGITVMDLHTVSSPSPAFAYVEDSLPARKLGLALGLPLILGFEEVLSGLFVDYLTNTLGTLSLLVEAGMHDDPASVRVHEAAIWAVLNAQGMVEKPDTLAGFDVHAQLQSASGRHAKRVFDLRSRVSVGEPHLQMLDRAQAFMRVWKGVTKVGRRVDASGKSHFVRAPADGLLFMPNRQQIQHAADDAFFVIRPIWRRFMWLSAWLRTSPTAQRLLRALPGVVEEPRRESVETADPIEPITLRVDHAVAVIMARDILHLFGYRVITSAPITYRRFWTRAVLALWVFPRVLVRLVFKQHEKNEIWLVRQHRLDADADADARSRS